MMPRYVEPVFRPPSEARSLIFQVTVGCSQNSCTFCGMYKGKRFQVRPVAEILAETFRERILRTDDSREGPRAFVEKRAPDWKCR